MSILLAASGLNGKEIALRMKTRPARVSKWLRRCAKDRIGALNDSPRSGEKRRKYTSAAEEGILKALDEAPPAGYSRWNGRLLCPASGRCELSSPFGIQRRRRDLKEARLRKVYVATAYQTFPASQLSRRAVACEGGLARKNYPLGVATSSLRARKLLNRRLRVCLRA